MTLPFQLAAVWAWLKRNWKWLLLPLGAALWLLGRLTARKEVVVTSTALADADEAKVRFDKDAATARTLADSKEASQLAGVAAQHSAAVEAVTRQQVAAAAAAQDSPEDVNSLLLAVGRDMRK